MSIAGRWAGGWGPCTVRFQLGGGPGSQQDPCTGRSHVGGAGGVGQGSLCGEVQCIMDNGHMGHPPCKTNDRQIRQKTLPSLASSKSVK